MFLNITDGFVGRGTKTIIILTTNEDVGKLHPAVSRPGRCAFNHKFGRLSKEESKEWFVKKGRKELAENVKGDMTIAELYATLNNKLNNLEQKTHSVGFLGE
jgi:ATP-dependent 26S proteasome regulatory subunit